MLFGNKIKEFILLNFVFEVFECGIRKKGERKCVCLSYSYTSLPSEYDQTLS